MNPRFKKIAAIGGALAVVLPGIASAATATDILNKISELIGLAVPLILALAVVFFLYSVLMYVTKAGEAQADARQQMLWGIIAIAVMVSIWGLVGILRNTFNLTDNQPIIPTVPTVNNQVNGGATQFQQTRNQ